ncbi:proteasome assembly chaperone family protein [Candidatus Woesearchaeota archaeon]|nr:proteasome assembly chaperone family protein [Candidatus Woesearchaeota archaeon]
MEIKLNRKPKNPIIIEGFPGIGFIGSITTEFLVEHLKAEKIGKIEFTEQTPVVAIHNSEVVEPFGIFYSKKYNLVILHAINPVNNIEWKITDAIEDIAKQLQAKEVISIEGVASMNKDSSTFYYSKRFNKKFDKINIKPLKEGIIMGVTASIMLREKLPSSCIFVETHSQLPDSRGAAKIIEALDKYLGLNVDIKPLLQKAEKFEQKLKGLMQQNKMAVEQKDQKQLDYLG